MGLVGDIFISLLNGLLVGTDIVCFFLFIRLLNNRFSSGLLNAFDQTGKPLVNWIMRFSEKAVAQLTARPLTVPQLIAAQLFTVCLLRWLIVSLITH
jgi:hypothetical protein